MSATVDPDAAALLIDGLSVRSFGRDDGIPVLFSAGLGGSGAYWRAQIDAFGPSYRIITYDHRGTGQSSRDNLGLPYHVEDMAADLALVLDGLGIDAAHVVGHAAGGVAALSLATTAPDRLLSITVVNGWAKPDPHFARCMAIRRDIYLSHGVEGYLRAQPLFLYPADYTSRHLAELNREAAEAAGGFQSRENLFARMAALEAFDVSGDLCGIRTPVLLIVSDDDALVPPSATSELAGRLSNARVIHMRWGGHAVNVTDPAFFNVHVRQFLDEVCAQKKGI